MTLNHPRNILIAAGLVLLASASVSLRGYTPSTPSLLLLPPLLCPQLRSRLHFAPPAVVPAANSQYDGVNQYGGVNQYAV